MPNVQMTNESRRALRDAGILPACDEGVPPSCRIQIINAAKMAASHFSEQGTTKMGSTERCPALIIFSYSAWHGILKNGILHIP